MLANHVHHLQVTFEVRNVMSEELNMEKIKDMLVFELDWEPLKQAQRECMFYSEPPGTKRQ